MGIPLQNFQRKNFELLILDVMREEVDGIALAKGIRERCVKSPGILLSLLLPKRICYDIDKKVLHYHNRNRENQ